jgi:hypothetical protein
MGRGILSVGILFASVSLAWGCGTERWAVKTGTDADAARVNMMMPQAATIAQLNAITAPSKPNSRATSRFAPTELQTFTVSGVLTVIKRETDEDYHLVIVDPNDTNQSMIVESPNPDCADGSVFSQQIGHVRSAIDQQFGSIGRKQHPNLHVTVTGVAFFDPIHGQEGVADNGIELHPLLSIQFHEGVPAMASLSRPVKVVHSKKKHRKKKRVRKTQTRDARVIYHGCRDTARNFLMVAS